MYLMSLMIFGGKVKQAKVMIRKKLEPVTGD